MTNNRIKQVARLMACLLAFACILGLGAGMFNPAYAEETGMTASSVPYTPVDEPVDCRL